MLQYVDDLLLSGEWEKVIKEATVKLGKKKKDSRVSEYKGFYKYHYLRQGKELRQFLGLVGCCRAWIEDFLFWADLCVTF